MNYRRVITVAVSFAITAVFLALALHSVDLTKLASAFASADYRLVAIGAVFTCASYVLRTVRWQRFLAPSKLIPVARLFPVLIVGFALNNLLPGRPGEFARAYAVGQREMLSKTLGFATIVVERVMDGFTLIAFLLLALAAFIPLHLNLPDFAERIAVAATLIFGIALAGMFFLLLREEVALALARIVTSRLPHGVAARVEGMLSSFVVGLHSLRSAGGLAFIVLLSVAIWACEASSYLFVLTAFGALPNFASRLVAAAFMMVLINLGVMIPAAPGGVGPFEAAGIFALGVFGLREIGASVALSAHAVQYLLITALGLLFIWREGISLAQTTSTPEAEE